METLYQLEWYLRALWYMFSGVVLCLRDVLESMGPSGYIAVCIYVIFAGVGIYLVFKLLRFMLRFTWIPIIVIAWEVAKRYAI